MSRLQAALYHLLISLVVFIGLAYLVVFVWYPDFFFTIDGGWEGLRIILFVDLVLGPLLTLCVYKAGKAGLKFDLACIGLLQTTCLAAGLYLVYQERPTFFIFYEGHFYSANKDTFERYNRSAPDPATYSRKTPVMVIAQVPEDPIEEADFREKLYKQRIPLWVFDDSYAEIEPHIDSIKREAFSYDELRERDTEGLITPWLEKHGGVLEDYAFFPVHSRYGRPFVAVRKSDNAFIDVLMVPAPLGRP